MRTARVFSSAAWALLVGAAPAAAGWTSLGALPRPRREGNALVFQGETASVAVSLLSPDIVRVRIQPGRGFSRDHSYAVVPRAFEEPGARFEIGESSSVVSTRSLRVVLRHDPFRVSIATASGAVLDEDDADRGVAFAGSAVRVWKRLRDTDHVFGFGEKAGGLDARGKALGGRGYAMWNGDVYGYDSGTDPLYVSVPFYMVVGEGLAYGVLLDNTFRTSFDVGHESRGLLSFGAEGGALDYYLLLGPSPKQVVSRLADLTGHMPLPPRWALGYQQCRYSYYPESRVRFIADNFRERKIPADALWLDIDYQDSYKPFTWDHARFPDPPRLIRDLRARGLRVVTIVDPHPKREAGYPPYDTGLRGGHFVKNADGTVYEGAVWPARAEHNPGPSVFPDFSRPATRDWWGALYAPLLDAGVAGIWNDMDEPAVFDRPDATMPLDVRHDNEGQPTDHREIHNVYGMLMSRATREGLLRLRPDTRPFVLTRASFAGGQRYAAVWSGDNTASWTHMAGSIPLLANLGLSGFPLVGADIGGFIGVPSAELFTRWLQLGVFYPFMRVHAESGKPDQEPWSFGTRFEDLNRRAIELRYELLPHIYNVLHEASETGIPALRPLFLEFPDDPRTYDLADEFFFGGDLLVAPVLAEGATRKRAYLPAGVWYDFWSGDRYEGPRDVSVPVTLSSLPVFARAGAMVFRQDVVQHTGEMAGRPLVVFVYPAARSSRELYEDDGETLGHERGQSLKRSFTQSRESGSLTLEVGSPVGAYRPAPRALVLRFPGLPTMSRVALGGEALPRLPADRFEGASAGWSQGPDGSVVVRFPDPFRGVTVTLTP